MKKRIAIAMSVIAILAPISACSSAPAQNIRSIDAFELYTHCGITWTIVDDVVYMADPELSDGQGNPPRGWGNPSQRGKLQIFENGTAIFTAGKLAAHFVKSEKKQSDFPLCS